MQDNYYSGRINEEMTMNSDGTAQIVRQKFTSMFQIRQKTWEYNLNSPGVGLG